MSARFSLTTAAVIALAAALVLTLLVTGTRPVAAAAAGSRLDLAGPPSATAGDAFRLTATLRSEGSPVADAAVQLERQVGDGWVGEGASTTDGSGVARFVGGSPSAP
jgi:hypothetical protein